LWILAAVTSCGLQRDPLAGLPAGVREKLDGLEEARPCATQALPAPVRETLERVLREKELVMAGPNDDWNSGCLVMPGLPQRQLLYVGRSNSSWLVHFQQGGFAILPRTIVLSVHEGKATVDWFGSCFPQPPEPGSPAAMPATKRWECRETRDAG